MGKSLNIFYGRESINKDRFIFDNVRPGTILIVPDQYSLQAEKDAFEYLGTGSLMDIEVLSFSRLSDRVLSEAGGSRLRMIDKQGRHMLLTKIMNAKEEDLSVYSKYKNNSDFLDMANNMISELKQCGIGPEDLSGLLGGLEGKSLFKQKLGEIETIYSAYEEAIEGHYIDTEDMANLFCSKIRDSQTVANSEFWIYGFDVFSPKNFLAIGELIKHSKGVNVVLTYDEGAADEGLFKVTGQTMERLVRLGEDANILAKEAPIPAKYRRTRAPELEHVERELFALPQETYEGKALGGLRFVRAGDMRAEAETAALTVSRLVREKGLRYRDIVLICNDSGQRAALLKQTFERYGIRIFADEKRSITHSPGAMYLLSLMRIISDGYRQEDIIGLLKSGLWDISLSDRDLLENYALKYRIKGAGWKKPFTKGLDEEDYEGIRATVMPIIMDFHERYKKETTIGGKVRVLYDFLIEQGIPEKLEALALEQDAEGKRDVASETTQVWNRIVGVLDQLVEILGEERVSASDFADMIRSGLDAVEIGVLPPALDGLVMGTMQRTRTGRIKAMLVIGANEGVLPLNATGKGLLSDEERERLMDMAGSNLLKTDALRTAEENMAIYRGFSKPEELLYISHSVTGSDGEATRSSMIYERMKKMMPQIQEEDDAIKNGKPEELVCTPDSTLMHLTQAIREPGNDDKTWKEVYAWYKKNRPDKLERIKKGFSEGGSLAGIGKDAAKELYSRDGKDMSLSPTRLESYGGCPFAHFMKYGIRAFEREVAQISGLEMGDVLHRCIDSFSRQMNNANGRKAVTDEASPWLTLPEEEIAEKVDTIIDEIAQGYKEGLLHEGGEEEYRLQRMKSVCRESVLGMVRHVRQGSIDVMMSEVGFGRGRQLKPIKVDTSAGSVYIEGKIDRMDIMPGGMVKIIDYKTGNDEWHDEEAKSGWKLQLALYMTAAMENGYSPAGSFFFHVDDPVIDVTGKSFDEEKLKAEIRKSFRMDGVMVASPEVVSEMDSGLGGKKTSEILPPQGRWLSEEDFMALMEQIGGKVAEMCNSIMEGNIEIKPKRSRKRGGFTGKPGGSGEKKTACDFCAYKNVCKFDTSLPGCRFEYV